MAKTKAKATKPKSKPASAAKAKPIEKTQKGLVNKNNAKKLSKAQKKRIDAAIKGRVASHVALSINNDFPSERTFEVADRVAQLAAHQIFHEDILNAIEAVNNAEEKAIESAQSEG